MSDSPTRDFDGNTSDISHTEHTAHGTSSGRPSRSKATPGSFAGAVNTDARGAIFTDIAGNQYNTYTNDASNETTLATLKPVDQGGYYVSPCMKGTREGIFKQVDEWLDDVNARNILWLSGSPGAGKSAIAASLVARFAERSRPCSSFFFRQGDVTLSDPVALWRTIAHRLARSNDSFTKFLVQGLKKVDVTRPDIDLHFKFLIMEPMSKCYDDPSSHSIPIILIDALDECGSERSQEPQRKAVLDTLVQWSRLRRDFKLIVTGRDERVTESFRRACYRIVLPSGGDVNEDTNNDIRCFFEERFAELGGSSFPEWPGESIIRGLTACAAGLFIWGETAMRFVEEGLPDERLALVLGGSLGDEDNITRLYRQILERSFRDVKGRALEVSKQVISAVVLAKTPFSCDDLHQFLSHPKTSIKFILSKLSSVISVGGTDERLRISHLSFSEFLCDCRRCPKELFIDRVEQSQNLAMECFQKMKGGLRFNICHLETSYLSNRVEDLSERIKTNIPGSLRYSCLFWAAHLEDTTAARGGHDALIKEVKDFLYNRFLYWLEVMSITEQLFAANIALLTAGRWIEDSDSHLSAFARDASRFLVNFDMPISTSVPHIYLSALPFSPSQSLVAKEYQPQFPNTLSIASGRDQNWPAMVNRLQGHTDWVCSVAFSPNGKRVVSGSNDQTIRIWDAETGQTVAGPFEGHTEGVWSVAFSPDGKRVVSGSDNDIIRIRDAETGQTVVGLFESHTGGVTSVAFSPDGKRIVSGSYDDTIRIWDAKTGQPVASPFEGHTDYVQSVAFSPDGKRVVSGSDDNTIRIWDSETGQTVAGPFEGHAGGVNSVAFSPDGKRVVSGSNDKTIRIWDAETGQTVTGPFEGHTDYVQSVAFSPDGKRVVSGSADSTIGIWDAKTGQTVARPFEGHTDGVTSVTFSPDSKWIVSGSYDNNIRIWDAETGQPVAGPFKGHADWVRSVAFSPDGKRVVSGSDDKTVRIWDAETGQTVAGPFKDHTGYVCSVAFSPDGKQIVLGSDDNTIRIWDAETGQTVAGPLKGHTSSVLSVAFSPEGKQVVSGSYYNTIRIWDAETGQTVAGPFKGHTKRVWSSAFSPDGKRVVSGSYDETIRIWDAATGQTVAGPFDGHTDSVYSVAFSPDGKRVVSGSDDNTIRIWDAEAGQTAPASFEGSTSTPSGVTPSSDVKKDIPDPLDPIIRPEDVELSQFSMRRPVATFQSLGAMYTFGEWCDDNGWLRASHPDVTDHQFLLWVPEAYRESLCDIRTLLILGKRTTQVDLSRFVHGTSWTECYSPSTETYRLSTAPIEVTSSRPPPPTRAEPSDRSNLSDTTVDDASPGASLCPSPRADSLRISHQPTAISSPLLEFDHPLCPSGGSKRNHSPPTTSRHVKPEEQLPGRVASDSSPSSYTRHLRNITFVIVPLLVIYYFHVVRNN